jgi:hypothetical protein
MNKTCLTHLVSLCSRLGCKDICQPLKQERGKLRLDSNEPAKEVKKSTGRSQATPAIRFCWKGTVQCMLIGNICLLVNGGVRAGFA